MHWARRTVIVAAVLILGMIVCIQTTAAEVVVVEETHKSVSIARGAYSDQQLDLEKGDFIQLNIQVLSGPQWDLYLLTDSQMTAYEAAVHGTQTDFGKTPGFTFEKQSSLSKYMNIDATGHYHLILDNTNASSTGAVSTGPVQLDFNLVLKRDVNGIASSENSSMLGIVLPMVVIFSFMSLVMAFAILFYIRRMSSSLPTTRTVKKVKSDEERKDS
jgi:hypothetical protein